MGFFDKFSDYFANDIAIDLGYGQHIGAYARG